jgi:integrase
MPRRRDERARVVGPHWIESKGYYCVSTVEPQANGGAGRRNDRYFREIEEANDWRQIVEARLARLEGVTVAIALDRYEQRLSEKGNKDKSREEKMRRLRLFFADALEMQIARLTLEKAKKLYAAFKSGRSVDYHRNALGNAKGFLRWAVANGLAAVNALAEVEGEGERSTGKAQLTGDEARKFFATALRMAEQGDDGALGSAMLLTMGLRQGEVRQRRVRDLDLDGTVLRVEYGKTKKARRMVRVPEQIRPLLQELAEDRDGSAVLFEAPAGEHTKAWLHAAVRRVCAQAGVPRVCPHGLRGTHATLALRLGESSQAVADALGHEDSRTTIRHYAVPHAAEDGAQIRTVAVLTGGRATAISTGQSTGQEKAARHQSAK